MSLTKATYSLIDGAPINVKDFGAKGNGDTDDIDALDAAIAAAAVSLNEIVFPEGNYIISKTLNFTHQKLRVRGIGVVNIIHTGTDLSCVTIDNGSLLYDAWVENINIIGNANTQNGLSMLNVVHATFKNIRVRNVSEIAFYVEGAVLNVYESIICSRNENALSPAPKYGLWLTNGTFGGTSTDNVFTNIMMEGMTEVGVYLSRADNNTFYNGTSEAHDTNSGVTFNGLGVYISNTSSGNLFHNFFCEANYYGGDLICHGDGNQFYNCTFASASLVSPFESVKSVILKSTAVQNVLSGCYFYAALVESSAESNRFEYCRSAYRVEDNATRTAIEYTLQPFNSLTIYPNFKPGNINNPDTNSLDWYEEGIFTPTFGGTTGNGTITHDVQNGRFTRIGDIVFFGLTVRAAAVSVAPSGALIVEGLPYLSNVVLDCPLTVGSFSKITLPASRVMLNATTAGNTTTIRLFGTASALDAVEVDASTLTAGSVLAIGGSYKV
jgi:hypothetical protein